MDVPRLNQVHKQKHFVRHKKTYIPYPGYVVISSALYVIVPLLPAAYNQELRQSLAFSYPPSHRVLTPFYSLWADAKYNIVRNLTFQNVQMTAQTKLVH